MPDLTAICDLSTPSLKDPESVLRVLYKHPEHRASCWGSNGHQVWLSRVMIQLKSIFRFELSAQVFLFSMLLQILYSSCFVCGILFKSEMHATQALSSVFIFLGKQEVSTNILGTAVCYRCHTSARKCSWANSERKFPSEGFAFHQHLKNIFPLAIIMLVSINYNDVKKGQYF